MKKRNLRILIPVIVIIALLAALAFLLRDAGDFFMGPSYDAQAPTSAKFVKMSRWVPAASEFDITIDIPRALANEQLRAHVMKIVKGKTGVASELVSALVNNEKAVGLMTAVGTLGNKDEIPKIAVLVQGRFDEKVMLPAVRAAMAAGRSGLSSENIGWTTLYTETNEREPFGFMILDKEHLAIGSRDALLAFYSQQPKLVESIGRLSDATIFGHAVVGPRLKAIMPQTLEIPQSVDFSSTVGQSLIATFHVASQEEAANIGMFLEGVRTIMMLQQEQNIPSTKILQGISITNAANEVTISTDIPPLLELW